MRIVLMTLLLIVTRQAWAEWTKFWEGDGSIFYADAASMKKDPRNPALRSMLQLINFKKPDSHGVLSSKLLVQYDCKKKMSRTLYVFEYAEPRAKGKVLFSSSEADAWESLVASSNEMELLKSICDV